MTINRIELLELAFQLAQQEGEVQFRTAVSKAYYYAYHDCQAWLKDLPGVGLSASDGGVHKALTSRLKSLQAPCTEQDKKRGRQKSYVLSVLKDKRTIADYKLEENVIKAMVEEAIAEAQRIVAY